MLVLVKLITYQNTKNRDYAQYLKFQVPLK
jgi:hypothetical protein